MLALPTALKTLRAASGLVGFSTAGLVGAGVQNEMLMVRII